MPSVLIEVRQPYSREQEVALLEAVQAALIEGFKIPAHDRNLRLVVHEPHRFMHPPGREHPERVTLVTIDAFAGRSLQAKRALYQAIVRNLEALGIPPSHVTIKLHELPKENWGIRGGKAGSDIDLGFTVEV